MKRQIFSIFLIMTVCAAAWGTPPFWEKNPKVLASVRENRKIATSVRAQAIDKQRQLSMAGVGLVQAPVKYVSDWARNFENMKRVSDYVQEVRWTEATNELYLHTEAFDYHARMWMDVKIHDADIEFAIKRGTLKGMTGALRFQKDGFATTLISLTGSYTYKEWPIPKLFLKFGLEVVLQKFAERLRAAMEQDFQKGVPAVSKSPKQGVPNGSQPGA